MATIRWCPIYPKWDSYQPLFNTNMSKNTWRVVTFITQRRTPDSLRCAPARYGQDSGPLDEVRQVEDVRAAARRIARRVNIRGPNGKPLKLWDIHWRFHVINEVILMKHREVLIWIRVGKSVALLWGLPQMTSSKGVLETTGPGLQRLQVKSSWGLLHSHSVWKHHGTALCQIFVG